MNKIIDLPNSQGFEFIGIRSDGSEIECFVHQDATGTYVALQRYINKRVASELIGWR